MAQEVGALYSHTVKKRKKIFFCVSIGGDVPQLPVEIKWCGDGDISDFGHGFVFPLAYGILFPAHHDYCGRAREIIGKVEREKAAWDEGDAG